MATKNQVRACVSGISRRQKPDVNYVVLQGRLLGKYGYSLSKLLDWRIGHAICITHRRDIDYVLVNDCPDKLACRLIEKIGGTADGIAWGIRGGDPFEVLREVTAWVDEQED
jgi:hypothetical protein